MYEKEKLEILKAALEIKRNNLIALAGGNVSVRKENGDFIVTASGMNYEEMDAGDLIVFNKDAHIIEGIRKPSVDTVALKYIYDHMPQVNAIIHTHQPYATAVGLIEDKMPVCVTTLSNVTLGEVSVAPYSNPASLEMGKLTVEYINGKRAVILKHHGVVAVGGDLKQALYAAVYLEEAAKTYMIAKAAGQPGLMTPEQNEMAVQAFVGVGQK